MDNRGMDLSKADLRVINLMRVGEETRKLFELPSFSASYFYGWPNNYSDEWIVEVDEDNQ